MQVVIRRSRKGKPFLITDLDHFMDILSPVDTVIVTTQMEYDLLTSYALVCGVQSKFAFKVPDVMESHVHITINWGKP